MPKYILKNGNVGLSSPTILQHRHLGFSISDLITTCTAGVAHLLEKNSDNILHSRWPPLNFTAGMQPTLLSRFGISLIAVSNPIPRLFAMTIYAIAMTEKIGLTHTETSQPFFLFLLFLLLLFSLVFVSSETVLSLK